MTSGTNGIAMGLRTSKFAPGWLAIWLAAAIGGASAARAEPGPTSRYTPLDLKSPTCRTDTGPAEGATCKGLAGWAILVGSPAVGTSVALSRLPADAQPSFSPKDGRALSFDGTSPSSPPVEWRGVLAGGRFEPFAAIVRMVVLDAAQRRETIEEGRPPARPSRSSVLVVFRLGREGACEAAYVDAQANPGANELARGAADTIARAGHCPVDHVAVTGKSSPILDGYLR